MAGEMEWGLDAWQHTRTSSSLNFIKTWIQPWYFNDFLHILTEFQDNQHDQHSTGRQHIFVPSTNFCHTQYQCSTMQTCGLVWTLAPLSAGPDVLYNGRCNFYWGYAFEANEKEQQGSCAEYSNAINYCKCIWYTHIYETGLCLDSLFCEKCRSGKVA
jgi:hypothetical protein